MMPNIVGNRTLLERFDRDIQDGTLSHAYILEGPVGSGKHTLAQRICAALACEYGVRQHAVVDDMQTSMFDDLFSAPAVDKPAVEPDEIPCGECRSCKKVLEGICPDIQIIGRDGKATIGVDAIRFLKTDVYMPPNDLDVKIYIIEDAETMTPQAQNALLLTLEEPPAYVLFLLLCNGAENLLETIRSRAPILHTECIGEDAMRRHLLEVSPASARLYEKSPEEFEAILLGANGCIGRAVALLDAKARKPILKQRETVDAFLDVCLSRRPGDVLAAITLFGSKRDEVAATIRMLQAALRDLLLLKKSEGVRLLYFVDREVALGRSDRFPTQALLALQAATDQALASLERNGNVRITLTRMCMDIGIL